MNEYLDEAQLGELHHAVDGINPPNVEFLVAGGLSRGRQLKTRAATRKQMLTFGGPTLAAVAVVGAVLLTSTLNGGNRGAAAVVATPGGSGSSSAAAGQPAPTTKSVLAAPTTKSVPNDLTTVAAQPVPPTTVAAQPVPPTTVAAHPDAPIDTQGLPTPGTPAAAGAVGALKELLPAGGSVVNPRVFPKDALTLAATYTRFGQSAQVTVAVFTAHQADGHAVCISGSNCVITTLPNGSRQLVTTYSNQHWEVMIDRTDGTLLTVSVVQVGDRGMPLTMTQLIGLARSGRWTHLDS